MAVQNRAIHNDSQPQSGAPSSESELLRDQLITLFLMESNAAYRLPVLEDDELAVTISSWSRVLKAVPEQFLQRCYDAAVARHTGNYALSAYEVKAVWDDASSSGLALEWFKEMRAGLIEGPLCEWCNGTGYKRVLEDGTDVKWESREQTNTRARCHCRQSK